MIPGVSKFDLIYDYTVRISLLSPLLCLSGLLSDDDYYLEEVLYFAGKNPHKSG